MTVSVGSCAEEAKTEVAVMINDNVVFMLFMTLYVFCFGGLSLCFLLQNYCRILSSKNKNFHIVTAVISFIFLLHNVLYDGAVFIFVKIVANFHQQGIPFGFFYGEIYFWSREPFWVAISKPSNIAMHENDKPNALETLIDKVSSANNEIIIYQPDSTVKLEVRLEDETVWLTQAQMTELFQTTRNNITLHIRNIFKEGELDENSVCKESLLTAADGKRYRTKFYSLDVIISVGYRVKSIRGTQFRQWANKILKEYLLRGYSVNQRLLYLESRIDRRFAEHDIQIAELSDKMDTRRLM